MKIASILLASGFSRRMGQDKMFLKIDGTELYKTAIDKISEIDFYKKITVTNNKEIEKYSLSKNFEVYSNPNASEGKSQSVKIGIEKSEDADACMIFVADQPSLRTETIEKLIEFYKENRNFIVYPTVNGEKSSPTIIPSKYFADLMKLEGDRGGAYIVNEENSRKLFISDEAELMDLDTEEDYKNFLEK